MGGMKLLIFIFALALVHAEEIETRKTVKKAGAVDLKHNLALRAGASEQQIIKVEVVQETSAIPSTTTTTEKVTESSTTVEVISSSTDTPALSTDASSLSIDATNSDSVENNSVDSTESEIPDDGEDLINNVLPPSEPPKRKVLYINQQQSGKLNVHLELSDVSVIVIPNQRDPQLSLLNLLFKSAQKSNLMNEATKKIDHQHDDYSKFKPVIRNSEDDYQFISSRLPSIESRAPYKVDISSTIVQPSLPTVDIIPNAHPSNPPTSSPKFQPQIALSPIMQLMKPVQAIPFTIQTSPVQLQKKNRISRRSIDSRVIEIGANIANGLNTVGYNDDELTESMLSTFDNEEDDLNYVDGSEFVLLGATENCGPGRKRNSYQICVAVDDDME